MKNDLTASYIIWPSLIPHTQVQKIPLHLLYDVYQDSPKEAMSVYFFHYDPKEGWWTSRPKQNGNRHSVTCQYRKDASKTLFLVLKINPFGEARFSQADAAAETPGCFYAIMGRNSENRLELTARLRVNGQRSFDVPLIYLFEDEVKPLCLLDAIIRRGQSEDQLYEEAKAIYKAKDKVFRKKKYSLERLVALLAIEQDYLPSFPTSQFKEDLLRLKQESELVNICDDFMGSNDWSHKNLDEAMRFYQASLAESRHKFSERTGDRRREIMALIRLSDILYLLDRREQAGQALEEALTIRREINNDPTFDEALIIATQGAFFRQLKVSQQAIIATRDTYFPQGGSQQVGNEQKQSEVSPNYQLTPYEYYYTALSAPGGDLTFAYVGVLSETYRPYHRFYSFKSGFHFFVDYYPSEDDNPNKYMIFLYAIPEDAWVAEGFSITTVIHPSICSKYKLFDDSGKTTRSVSSKLGRMHFEIKRVLQDPEAACRAR